MPTILQPFASVSDLAEWLGEDIQPDSTDWKRAERILAYASNKIRSYTGRVWNNTDGTLPDDLPPILADITVSCASRYYLNPTGETQWSKQIDDAMDGGSRKVDESGLYLTASEKDELDRLVTDTSKVIGGITTVGSYRGDAGSPDADDVWYVEPHQQALWAKVTGDG